ncbi:unnamed protein product [Fusarium fujikuroi]|nr:unnamed protein product [Fusarium fujikuroi]
MPTKANSIYVDITPRRATSQKDKKPNFDPYKLPYAHPGGNTCLPAAEIPERQTIEKDLRSSSLSRQGKGPKGLDNPKARQD